MPRFYPNKLISDCWSSCGNVTFYHREGRCYFRTRKRKTGTTNTNNHTATVHSRALSAWRSITQEEQNLWNKLALQVSSHKPPFGLTCSDHNHITGNNLFVSAYHGFATLDNEHTPRPQDYQSFPQFLLRYHSTTTTENTDLKINFLLTIWTDTPERYVLLGKIMLAKPGKGINTGLMRNHLATMGLVINSTNVKTTIQVTFIVTQKDPTQTALHMRYLLLDRLTGYRCNFKYFHHNFY